jgi:hypothetical protein
MTWLDDVKATRLKQEAQKQASTEAEKRKYEELYRPLTPDLCKMISQLLNDVGEAYWGTGKYIVEDRPTSWLVRSPPSGDSYHAWYISYDRAEYKTISLIFWKFEMLTQGPRIVIRYKGPASIADPTSSSRSWTFSLSEDAILKLVKRAVSIGPYYSRRSDY